MHRFLSLSWIAILMPLQGAVAQSFATPATINLQATRIASGLTRPVFGTVAPNDPSKMFVVQQRLGTNGAATDSGEIRILDLNTGTIDPTPFLTVSGLATGNEQGLLGMTFHPDYANNGKFYVNYTSKTPGDSNNASTTRIVEYMRQTPTVADPASARPIISIVQQANSNHKGGWIGFDPTKGTAGNGNLYIGMGDGGGANDPLNNAQNTSTLLGKILRINVDGDDFLADPNANYSIPASNPFVGAPGNDEIWAYGIRNPWRNSFDRLTGDFYIADVGQGRWEEINVQPANSTGGQNYGWDLREGAHNADGSAGNALPTSINPILDYAHPGGAGTDFGLSITGGYVYRGPIAELQGQYFYADYLTERIWSLEWNGVTPGTNTTNLFNSNTEWTNNIQITNGNYTIDNIVSFGEDLAGNLYIFDLGNGVAGAGEIFRINAAAVPEPSSLALVLATGIGGLFVRRRR